MADAQSAIYKFVLPEVGASDDTWGTKLNANLTALDGLLSSSALDETGFAGGTTSILGTALRIAGITPYLQLTETDVTLPAGHYRLAGSAGSLLLTANTAAAGDFTTATNIFIASASSISFGVPVGGSGGNLTFTSNPTISSTSPALYIEETDQTDPAGHYRFYGTSGNFYFQRSNAADWGGSATIWSYAGPATNTVNFSAHITTAAGWSIDAGTDTVAGSLKHNIGAGYLQIGSYNTTTYGNGFGRLYWDEVNTRLLVSSASGGSIGYFGVNESLTYGNTRLATTGGTVEIGHSGGSSIQFNRSGINYIRLPDSGTLRIQTFGAVNLLAAGTSNFTTYLLTNLAVDDGTVGIGNASSSTIEFKRASGGINYLKPPDGSSLKVQNMGGTSWATVSSASGWVAGNCDIRLKENVSDIHYGLDTVMQLRPVEFDRLADGLHDLGLVSQEVQPIVPEAIEPSLDEESGETYLFLRKDNFVPILIKAIQELTARVQMLEGAK